MVAKFTSVCLLSLCSFVFCDAYFIEPSGNANSMDDRQQAAEFVKQGNFREAFERYRKAMEKEQAEDQELAEDFLQAVFCLRQLQKLEEIDPFRENLLKIQPRKWRLHLQIGSSYIHGEHFGFITAGDFYRGNARGSGDWADSTERDRIRGIQILNSIRELADQDETASPTEIAEFYFTLAGAVELNREHTNSWKLQVLSDLGTLPDYNVNEMQPWGRGHWGGAGWGGAAKGAPVDADGNPVFYSIPGSWEEAKNDGERVRWAREKAATIAPEAFRDRVDLQFAQFLAEQFGVQTMAQYGLFFREQDDADADAEKPQVDSPFAVSSLSDDETICRLANGIKRIKLPPEFNHLRLYQNLAARPSNDTAYQAHAALGGIYENRQQYPRAVEHYQQALKNRVNDVHVTERLNQITKPWGMFEAAGTQSAAKGASVEFRFRNGKAVSFKANKINIEALLKDLKDHLSGDPKEVDWNRLQLETLGYSMLQDSFTKYVGQEVASWDLPLEPRPNHFDRRINITTPLQNAGAYLLTASMADGNQCSVVMWVADTAIARKQIDNGWLYMVVDAETGKPIANANVEFFGWRSNWNQQRQQQFIETKNFAEVTDQDGFVQPNQQLLSQEFQWLTIARTQEGRLAFLGMNSVWFGRYQDAKYQQTKFYGISDRPIYRPGQTVKYKFWIRDVSYQVDRKLAHANEQVRVQIYDPQRNVIHNDIRKLDSESAYAGEIELPINATLGAYTVRVSDLQNRRYGYEVLTFRIEEYKKPEFEVTVIAPDKPARLGDSIPVKIAANYYFGGPVSSGVVKYKVHRTKKNQRWFPIGRWDWLYGNGYLWLGSEYHWYPGFSKWGCFGPVPPWSGFSADPPELLLDEEGVLKQDGTLEFAIDTAIIKVIHGSDDHEFAITAEVVDSSRRTIVGSGNVVVARRPFSVYVYTDRGYARTGDPIQVSAQARTADGKGVAGKGKLVLYRIEYDADGKPTETELQAWDVVADETGKIEQRIKATEAGQFRLAVSLTNEQDEQVEGGSVLQVVGEQFDSANFRFNDLEVVVEKAEYLPGDKVKLLLNSNRTGARLMIWERPQGVYAGRPKVISLDGKSTVYEMTVGTDDMPNFFLEVMTVFGGKVHVVTKEIYVPPISKVVNVEIEPSETKVLPGQKTQVKIKLTEPDGKPFTGSLVMTMYDRAIEYISGGSNVGDIRENFWKWKRHHHPNTEHSLSRSSNNLVKDYAKQMQFLGVFGSLAADVMSKSEQNEMGMPQSFSRSAAPAGGMGGGGGDAMAMPMLMEASADSALAARGGEGAGRFNSDQGSGVIEPVVRTNFADSAYWSVDLRPNAAGIAETTITMPESLTAWKIRTWAIGTDTSVGEGTTEIVTAKNIMVRLQAPRFFVEKDEVILSAVVHNYLDVGKLTEVSLDLDGDLLQTSDALVQRVDLPAGGEKRVDWRVRVKSEGTVAITMSAKTDVESDAMKMEFPVLVHGMLKTESFSRVVRPDETGSKFTIRVPQERRPELSRLEIRYSPTLAGAMVDALPYLNEYPYGCTEQTLNRFLPTLVTLNVLKQMNLDLAAIRDKQTNLNTQEIGDDQERAKKRWAFFNPVFDEEDVLNMAKQGVADLTKMQNRDGGWGWFSGTGERSWPHTTATVVRGLQLAQANGMGIVPDVLGNGIAWLKRYQDEQINLLIEGDRQKDLPADQTARAKPYRSTADNVDALVYLTLVEADIVDPRMADYLYRDRGGLSLYGKGLVGLAFDLQQDHDRRDMLIQNIDQFVKYDDENQSAFIDLPNQNYWWYWYGDTIEANAIFLKLMARTRPQDKVTLGLVKYLINNRHNGVFWKSTRDTALCVEAFAEFLKASGEATPEMTIEIVIDGSVVKQTKINAQNLFEFDNKFVIEGVELSDGEHEVEIRRTGGGTVYANAYLTNFTQEDEIMAAGLEIKVQRQFYRLEKLKEAQAVVAGDRGQAVDQKLEKYNRVPLKSWDEVRSGDLIEIELEIDSKNDYEYVIFEDMKAAGCEPVDNQSGYVFGGLNAYVEFRDQKVAFFARVLNRGKHSVKYRLRAETPGQFSALPTKAYAMYAPELRANSDEMKLKIGDRPDLQK